MLYLAIAVVSVIALGGYLIATRPNQEQEPTEWQATRARFYLQRYAKCLHIFDLPKIKIF